MTENNSIPMADELLDEDLKKILGKRYQDVTHLFTPEAQEKRRNHRVTFTVKIALFFMSLTYLTLWAHFEGFMRVGTMAGTIAGFAGIIGYNIGVCVSHLKGWRD